MPPSAVGANRFAGQAVTHALVVQDRQTPESTVMCARWPTRNSTVPISSANDVSGQPPPRSPTGGHRNTRAPERVSRSRPDRRTPFRFADRRARRASPGLGTGFVTVNTPSARSQTIPGYRC